MCRVLEPEPAQGEPCDSMHQMGKHSSWPISSNFLDAMHLMVLSQDHSRPGYLALATRRALRVCASALQGACWGVGLATEVKLHGVGAAVFDPSPHESSSLFMESWDMLGLVMSFPPFTLALQLSRFSSPSARVFRGPPNTTRKRLHPASPRRVHQHHHASLASRWPARWRRGGWS